MRIVFKGRRVGNVGLAVLIYAYSLELSKRAEEKEANRFSRDFLRNE